MKWYIYNHGTDDSATQLEIQAQLDRYSQTLHPADAPKGAVKRKVLVVVSNRPGGRRWSPPRKNRVIR